MGHKAIIAEITKTIPIEGAQSIHIAVCLGERVVVSKEWGVGHVGVFFPVDVQLSEEYCRENNLFRRAQLNKDPEKTGFFEENRRVRAQPFLKQKSEGLFMDKASLNFAGGLGGLPVDQVGQEFDELNGHKICQKYYSEASQKVKGEANKTKPAKKNYAPFFEKHVDSDQFKHYADRIEKGSLLYFHSKRHGTSFRVARTKVLRELPVWQQRLNQLVKVFGHTLFKERYEFDYVIGTRNVVLKTGDKEKVGFHGPEGYRFEVFEQIKPFLTDGVQIFGEIVGYVNGKPIMPVHDVTKLKDKRFTDKYGKQVTYHYGCKEHEYKFHIYRVALLQADGTLLDLSQKQMEKWCEERSLPYTLEVHPPILYDGDEQVLRELVESLTERPECLTEAFEDPTMIGEGIIVRIENGSQTPKFMKSKSFAFRCMESLCEATDPEGVS